MIPAGLAVNGTDRFGRKWRVLEGDFSHVPEHDRPPRYICETLAVGARIHFDRSDTRQPIPSSHPGKDIRELKGRHAGTCALLFNGASLDVGKLRKVRVPLIGMNRTHVGYHTWKGPQPDYLCVADAAWINSEAVRTHPGLINGTQDPRPFGWRVPISYRMAPFSFDLWRDGALPTTTGLLALQVAVYLGFTDLYCLGLDLGGPHYDGTPSGHNMGAQERYCRLAAPLLKERGVNVWLCGSPESESTAFPPVSFDSLLEA